MIHFFSYIKSSFSILKIKLLYDSLFHSYQTTSFSQNEITFFSLISNHLFCFQNEISPIQSCSMQKFYPFFFLFFTFYTFSSTIFFGKINPSLKFSTTNHNSQSSKQPKPKSKASTNKPYTESRQSSK